MHNLVFNFQHEVDYKLTQADLHACFKLFEHIKHLCPDNSFQPFIVGNSNSLRFVQRIPLTDHKKLCFFTSNMWNELVNNAAVFLAMQTKLQYHTVNNNKRKWNSSFFVTSLLHFLLNLSNLHGRNL